MPPPSYRCAMNRAHFPVDGLEDDALAAFAGGASEELAVQLSIAISLKRLADAQQPALSWPADVEQPQILKRSPA